MLTVKIPDITPKLTLHNKVLTIGSCFSAHMHEKLTINKIDAISHPFGTLYHPRAIRKALYPKEMIEPNDLIESNELWFHWDAHSSIWGNSIEEVSQRYQAAIEVTKKAITTADWLIITLGSAFIYKLKSTNKFVANCHKVPQSYFNKELSTESGLYQELDALIKQLWADYPKLQILLTVSPVRHYRDGLVENNVSKGRLLAATFELSKQYDQVHYFPSYEIVIDELRDYGFYKADSVHPGEQAIEIIWERLQQNWMELQLQEFITHWSKIRQAIQHRPLYPGSKSHIKFLQQTIRELEALHKARDFSYEIQTLYTELKNHQ